jgi:hypothetical protein
MFVNDDVYYPYDCYNAGTMSGGCLIFAATMRSWLDVIHGQGIARVAIILPTMSALRMVCNPTLGDALPIDYLDHEQLFSI